jgi:hypothetical protein
VSRLEVHDLFADALAFGLARIDSLTDEELNQLEESDDEQV